MQVTGLKIENFMKIDLLEVHPTGIVKVKGKNGAGKSTVLDAIYFAIAGGNKAKKPIKDGETKATINVTLEGKDRTLEITRTITEKSNTLKVMEDGKERSKPAALLNSLINKISIDPQKFLDLPEKDQAELIAQVCKVDFDFTAELANHNDDVDERKALKREVTSTESKIESIVIPKDLDMDLDVAAINKELEEANAHNAKVDSDTQKAELLKAEGNRIKERFAEIKTELESIGVIDGHLVTSHLRDQLAMSSEIAKVAQVKDLKEDLKKSNESLKAIEKKIEDRSKRKSDAIANANIPVEGLSTNGTSITLNDIPFNQSSSAERIKVATTIAVLANSDLKLINIKDASLMDEDTMAEVVKVAKANDCQLFMEVVSDSEDVVLEFSEPVEKKKATKKKAESKVEPAVKEEPKEDLGNVFGGLDDL